MYCEHDYSCCDNDWCGICLGMGETKSSTACTHDVFYVYGDSDIDVFERVEGTRKMTGMNL
jgi:hypothetical protein